MPTISKNGAALTIIIAEAILTSIGVEFDANSLAKAVEGILYAAALVLAIWNQFDRHDVSAFFFKKSDIIE